MTRLLLGKRQELARRTGADLELRWVVDTDLERPRDFPVPKELLSRNVQDILDDPEVEVVVELVALSAGVRWARV